MLPVVVYGGTRRDERHLLLAEVAPAISPEREATAASGRCGLLLRMDKTSYFYLFFKWKIGLDIPLTRS
jgi:hypothetical protein